MALFDLMSPSTWKLILASGSLVAISSLFLYLFHRPPFPRNAPKRTTDSWPILGSLTFFTRRWDFYLSAVNRSETGNFSFYAGQLPVVGLSGEEQRKIFFEHKALSFAEGYGALLAGSPNVKETNNILVLDHEGNEFSTYFQRRLIALLRGSQVKKSLASLLKDARTSFDALAAQPSNTTDPFDSIYRMVFQFTMRTMACYEIADNPLLLAKCLYHFEAIQGSVSALSIMFSWLPLPSKALRMYHSARLYVMFKNVIDSRKKHNRQEADALQFLLDQGDNLLDILTFVLTSLFAGQLNSGIVAAYILCYLASEQYWWNCALEEVQGVADKYCPDPDASLPLKERLMRVPVEAWEGEFPVMDVCLKDTIRLQTPGTAFRKNMSDQHISLSKSGEVIPAGAYVILAAGGIHLNPDIYEDPDKWDPTRYLSKRQEDKKQQYAWMGWGLGRHPCLGMRFAKLEINIIVSMFLAYFEEAHICDVKGNKLDEVPKVNRNNHTAKKPDVPLHLKYKARQEMTSQQSS